MSRRIVVSYDHQLQRWEIGEAPWVGRSADVDPDTGTGLLIVDGVVRDFVLDAARPDPEQLDAVAAAFGPSTRATVANHDPDAGSLDTEVLEASELDTFAPPSHAIDGEPGRPRAGKNADSSAGTHQVVPDIRGNPEVVEVGPVAVAVSRSGSELVIEVTGLGVGDDVWVRISESDSGELMALSRLRREQEGAESGASVDEAETPRFDARATFGLGVELSELHVAITDDPLAPVGSNADRRREWCDRLCVESRTLGVRRPGRAATAAMTAMTIATTLGDKARYARASALFFRARRWRRIWWLAPVMVVVVVAVAFWIGGGGADDTEIDDGVGAPVATATPADTAPLDTAITAEPTTTPATTTPPATTPATTMADVGSAAGGFVGPSTYRLGDEVFWSITTPSALVETGATTLALTGAETWRGLMNYSTPENCRASTGIPGSITSGQFPAARPVLVRIVPIGDGADQRGTRLAGPISFDADLAETSVIADTCGTVGDLETGAWGEAWFQREPRRVEVELETPLDAGRWSIELVPLDGSDTEVEPQAIELLARP